MVRRKCLGACAGTDGAPLATSAANRDGSGRFRAAVDKERRHFVEECHEKPTRLGRQVRLRDRFAHQREPPVAGCLIDGEGRVPRTKARMTTLFDVPWRAAEPADQKVAEPLLGTRKIVRRVHRPEDVVVRDTAIERSREPGEPVIADQSVNVNLLHGPCAVVISDRLVH